MVNSNCLLPPNLLEIGGRETSNFYGRTPFLRSYHICARDSTYDMQCLYGATVLLSHTSLPTPFSTGKFRFTTYHSSSISHPRNITLR